MDLSHFSLDSKVWVYPIKATLNASQVSILDEKLAEFMGKWKAHGAPVTAAYKILDNRFIVISADANCTAASGCSIDSMRKNVSQALNSIDSDISDFSSIYFIKDNDVLEVSRPEFAELKSSGQIKDNDKVFNITPANLKDFLTNGICLEFKDSWHSSVFK